jgi:hypothetical protein
LQCLTKRHRENKVSGAALNGLKQQPRHARTGQAPQIEAKWGWRLAF